MSNVHTLMTPTDDVPFDVEPPAPAPSEPPYLSRREVGIDIELHLDLDARPVVGRIDVIVADGKMVLDTFKVTGDDAHDAYRHTAMYSEPYAEALR